MKKHPTLDLLDQFGTDNLGEFGVVVIIIVNNVFLRRFCKCPLRLVATV